MLKLHLHLSTPFPSSFFTNVSMSNIAGAAINNINAGQDSVVYTEVPNATEDTLIYPEHSVVV